ncbi:hypothetical protein FE257_010614 [Aspergillus nanangensis]|uniref:Enoyl reductase (ER) domain-containing protein n=1 Tax=Aspergillus nanangensis TaxID=2582783 RepID=A0AAD4CJM4_ASPNN|nr:hypothetical protein FE257_010614 [Aspergillus nanangensis]
MKAWLYTSTAGGLEKNLHLDPQARMPGALRDDQILVKVISASLNPADYKVTELGGWGTVSKVVVPRPATPGMDFCGRVVIAAPSVKDVKRGQLVYGTIGIPSQFGSMGEYLITKASTTAPLPDGLDPDDAAAVGVAAQTAYQSVVPYVSRGDNVFINAGSGGCGIFAIQMAKLLGCQVTTTCSTQNAEFCKSLGADEVIDYTVEDVVAVLKGKGQVFDHVVDHMGTPEALYRECDAFLRPGKAFVQVGGPVSTFADRLVRPSFLGGGKRKYVILLFKNRKEEVVQIGEWIRQGKIKVVIDSTFELDDAVKAIERLKTSRSRGKIIIHVSNKETSSGGQE